MTNAQAEAYAALAMSSCGIEQEQLEQVCREICYLFDMVGEEEAEERFSQLRQKWSDRSKYGRKRF